MSLRGGGGVLRLLGWSFEVGVQLSCHESVHSRLNPLIGDNIG